MRGDLLTPFFADPAPTLGYTMPEWELLLGQARRAGLVGRLAWRFDDCDALTQVPEGPRRHLQSAMRLLERQRADVAWEVDCIRRALSPVGTPLVLLKGAAYLLADLPPARGRLFADVDIMVGRDRLPAAEAALFAAGWIVEKRDPYTNRYYREWMHELPPMRHVQRGTVLDVHHTIAPPTSRFKVDGARLLERIRPVPGHDALFVLAPTDMVLHSATHLFQEGELWHGLRDLLDLEDLVGAFSLEPGFWPELLDRAAELGLSIPLSHALCHLERIFGTRAPVAMRSRVAALDRRVISRRLMAYLLTLALRPEHPSCDGPFSRAARFLLYVRSHHLRMPPHRLMVHLTRKALMRDGNDPRQP